MEKLPLVTDNYFMEQAGVNKVKTIINELRLVFRETPNADVGIDAQVEHVNNSNQVVGKTIALQIKSGESYLIDKGDHFAFYPTEKHRNYWESYPLPVIVVIYSPKANACYFADARHQLNIPNSSRKYISFGKHDILSDETKDKLFESIGELDDYFLDLDQVLLKMIATICPNPSFAVSFFDLFVHGLTNLCRQLYFHTGLAIEIAEFNNDTDFGLGFGVSEHKFLNDYAKFILSQNLARIDYADYLIDWKERFLQPTFMAPLTSRGRGLVEMIAAKEKELFGEIINATEKLLTIYRSPLDMALFEKAKQFRSSFPQQSNS